MDKNTFISVLETVLGARDRYGHFKRGDMRVKIQRISWRFEVRSYDRWIKLFGAYYSATDVPHIAKITRRFNQED